MEHIGHGNTPEGPLPGNNNPDSNEQFALGPDRPWPNNPARTESEAMGHLDHAAAEALILGDAAELTVAKILGHDSSVPATGRIPEFRVPGGIASRDAHILRGLAQQGGSAGAGTAEHLEGVAANGQADIFTFFEARSARASQRARERGIIPDTGPDDAS